jgi:type VI protein secretion system component Hcp
MIASELYVRIGDVTRSCGTRDGLEDYLPCSAFELDVAAGRAPGASGDRHTAMKPLRVATEVSAASPRLLELACVQRALEVEILLLRYDEERGHDRPYYRYTLHHARIVGLSQRIGDGGSGDIPGREETLSLVAETVAVENLWSGQTFAYDWS